MNRFLVRFAVLLGLLTLTGVHTAEAQAARFGYINSQRILAEAPGTAEAQAQFESTMQQYQQELASLETELQTLQDNLERQQATLTAAVRQERVAEIQQKLVTYQQRRQELEQAAQQRQAELVQPIMERIHTVIDEIQAEGNYALIFDAAAGSLIAADPALDLTQQVLDRLAAANP